MNETHLPRHCFCSVRRPELGSFSDGALCTPHHHSVGADSWFKYRYPRTSESPLFFTFLLYNLSSRLMYGGTSVFNILFSSVIIQDVLGAYKDRHVCPSLTFLEFSFLVVTMHMHMDVPLIVL